MVKVKRLNSDLSLKIWTAFVILYLCSGFLAALDPGKPSGQYLVDKWEMTQGLPSDSILSITQTPDGYLWLATSKSLVRFDGVSFTPFPAYTPDMLLLDRTGILWLCGPGGLTSYDYKSGRFKTYSAADGLLSERCRRLKDDLKGNVWICSWASYVQCFSNGKLTAFNAGHGLEDKKIDTILEDHNGNLLFGGREKGIFKFDNGRFLKHTIAGLESSQIIYMQEDSKNNLWVGTTEGLFRVSGKGTTRYTTAQGLAHNYISYIMEDGDKNVWVGTLKGLNRIIQREDGTIAIESLLPSYQVLCIFEDKEKNLWVGTLNDGLNRLKDGKFISYEPLEAYKEEIFLSLFEDRGGDVWIGTFSGKLFHCRGNKCIDTLRPAELSGTGISSIAEDREGNLWLGTIGKGVFQKKGGKYSQYTTTDGLADNTVISIRVDSRGNLWFCTHDGISVFYYGHNLLESFTSNDGLSGKVMSNVYENKNQDIWIAGEKGITILPKAFVGGPFRRGRFSRKEPPWPPVVILSGVSVSCIYEDPSASPGEGGVYWIATGGEGLKRYRMKDGKMTTYGTADGMTTNRLYQCFEDREGYLWWMSDSGVLRIDKSQLNRFAAGETDNINCISFGISDGLKSLEFNNELSGNSALKDRDGQLWFITNAGISMVNPGKVPIDKTPPRAIIETVSFNQQPVPLHQEASAYNVKGITDFNFHFTAPTFLSPGKIRFKYRLEGHEKEWVLLPVGAGIGSGRFARYANLRPGKYTFRVIACNADGVWEQTGDAFSFTLEPYFHQTVFFKIILLLLLVIPSSGIYYLYKNRPLKRSNTEEKKKYQGSLLDSHTANECVAKLKHLMEVEKIYRDEEISLQSLAQMASTTPHTLSQILNEKLNQNFSDFINSYRVEEAMKIMTGPGGKDKKNWIVAHDIGFNNMGVFYRAFKKYTGMTPNEYKKNKKSP